MAFHSRKRLAPWPLFTALTLPSLTACEETGPRVYTAKAYDLAGQCLGADTPIGLVEAEGLRATCQATCLELGGALYVSTVCPPYPTDSVELGSDGSPDCAAALSAFSEGRDCEE